MVIILGTICQNLKQIWQHMVAYGAGNVKKRFDSFRFHPISATLYENIGFHAGKPPATFLGQQQFKFKHRSQMGKY